MTKISKIYGKDRRSKYYVVRITIWRFFFNIWKYKNKIKWEFGFNGWEEK